MVLDYRDKYSEIGFCVGLDNAQLNSVANKTSVTVTPYDNEKINTDDGLYHYTNKNEYSPAPRPKQLPFGGGYGIISG